MNGPQFEVTRAQEALSLLSGRWVLPVLRALAERPQRPSELRAAVGDVSDQVFYDTLDRLDRQGMIYRGTASSQPGVYALTSSGSRTTRFAGQIMSQMAGAADPLHLLAGKWVLPILIAISEGNARPIAISDRVVRLTGAAVSDKAMHAALHRLTENSLITRFRTEAAPPVSEYRTTDLGLTALASARLFTGLDTDTAHHAGARPGPPPRSVPRHGSHQDAASAPSTDAYASTPELDPTVPSTARMYDYYLGGKDNFASDRDAAERIFGIEPNVPAAARANRGFLIRAVRHIAGQGVRQFVDLGTGIPTSPNVHETLDEVSSDYRVVYVDNDPVVMAHSRAMLDTDGHVVVVNADIRRPDAVLDHPAVRALIDFDRPVAVLLVSVLHFFDDADAARIVEGFRGRLVPGSYLAISTGTSDGVADADQAAAEKIYALAHTRARARTIEEIGQYFAGCELVDPGIVRVERWRAAEPSTRASLVGGVARIVG